MERNLHIRDSVSGQVSLIKEKCLMSEKSQMRTQYPTAYNDREIAVLDWKDGISMIVPAFRKPADLRRALESLKIQNRGAMAIPQFCVFSPLSQISKLFRHKRYISFMRKAAEGAGKVLWYQRFRPKIYGATALKINCNEKSNNDYI